MQQWKGYSTARKDSQAKSYFSVIENLDNCAKQSNYEH